MSFTIVDRGGLRHQAVTLFNTACKYLRNSNMATFILDSLEKAPQVITVEIGKGLEDRYYHPQKISPQNGGKIWWDPTESLAVVDQAPSPSIKYRKTRPDVPWTKERTFLGRIKEKIRGPKDRHGIITPALCLLHEMGHAYQYLSDSQGYLSKKGIEGIELEHINVAAIENTVALELTGKGMLEGIRWDYYALK